MHRHGYEKKSTNPPFKPPARTASAGNAVSVPAAHGSGSQDRIDASRSAWSDSNSYQGPSNGRGGYNNSNRTHSGSYGGRQADSSWGQRSSGGNEGYGYGPSSNKVVSMIDDFADSVENNKDKYGVDKDRQAALQRDAPKLSPGKAKATAEAKDRMDNLHSRENELKARRAAEDKKKKEEKATQATLKRIADEEKARAERRAAADAAKRSVSALPSSRKPSTSSSTLPRQPTTYSKADKLKRDKLASAAEKRQRKERGGTDDIEDADDDSDDIEVVQQKVVKKDLKGKGKQKEFSVEVPSPKSKPSNSKLAPVDLEELMKPNKPVSKSSSGRVSSPVRSSQSKVIDLADSPEKRRPSKPVPPARAERSPSPEHADLNLKELIEQERKEEEAKAKKEEKRREREKKRIVLSADEEDDEDDENSEEAVRRELMEGSPRGRFSKTPDPLLWAEETRADPSTLCPFCSRVLPTKRSATLSNLLQYLLARPDIVDLPTTRNPAGKRLPVVQTANFCRMHEEEMVVIPEGIAKGWPTEIDWEGLPKRIDRQLSQHLSDIITGKMLSPFFEDAKKEWEAQGNKMKNILSEYGTFEVEQPGYYGSRGHELIVATLTRLFVTQTPLLAPFRCTPLDPSAYIRRVLVPETAVQLIKADLSLPDDESARAVLQESRAFGRALWQSGLEGKEAERKFIKEEERREEREEVEEEQSQEKEKKAGGGKEKGKGKEREQVVMTEAEGEKEKRREKRRQEKAIIARAEKIAKGYTVMSDDDEAGEGGGKDDRSTARRKPKVGSSAPPPPAAAAPPTKRKPKQQLNSERMAVSTSASGSVKTSTNGGSESDSDDLELTTIKKRKPQPKAPASPPVKRKPGASSTSTSKSLSIPRSAAASSSSSDDAPLPRVKAKATTKLKTKARPSSTASSTKSKPSKRPFALESALDSDSDTFPEEIKTNFKQKKGKVAAPWETKRGKRKGAGAGGSEDDTPPPDSDEGSSDDEMEVD